MGGRGDSKHTTVCSYSNVHAPAAAPRLEPSYTSPIYSHYPPFSLGFQGGFGLAHTPAVVASGRFGTFQGRR